VRRQAAAEAGRASLSRNFSPKLVQKFPKRSSKLGQPRVQGAAMLFADMEGFTAISEKRSPEALVGPLHDFHGRLARVAFAHDGTVDKYTGDARRLEYPHRTNAAR